MIHSSNNVGEEYQKWVLQTARTLDQKLYKKAVPTVLISFSFRSLFFNCLGWISGNLFLNVPPPFIANTITRILIRSRFKGDPPTLSETSLQHIEQASSRVKVQRRQGKKVLCLVLTSHPKTTSEEFPMIMKLIWTASEIAKKIAPHSKFKILQAIDPFALDTLSFPLASFYSGFMAQGHVAIDRQPYERNKIGRSLFQKYHYARALFRILNSLNQKDFLCMALGGGVVHNARTLYVIKEFAHKLYCQGFKTKSQLELRKDLIRILTKDYPCCAVTGRFSSEELGDVKAYLSKLGLSSERIQNEINELQEEFSMQTPYRLRFFRILCGRLLRGKNELLLIPLQHKMDGNILVGEPLLISHSNSGNDSLFKNFVREHLNV